MTPNQRARRHRVIEAALAMITEGGVEDVQMRALAERSGVALGTVYRYFSSRDHVVAAALVEWASELDRHLARRPAEGLGTAERLQSVLRAGVRAFQRSPEFAEAMILAGSSDDPHAWACYQQMGQGVQSVLRKAIDGELTDDEQSKVLVVVNAVWYTALVSWVHGRITIDQVHVQLDAACEVALGWRERQPSP
jgi:AcrR family transcriptional regulator